MHLKEFLRRLSECGHTFHLTNRCIRTKVGARCPISAVGGGHNGQFIYTAHRIGLPRNLAIYIARAADNHIRDGQCTTAENILELRQLILKSTIDGRNQNG